MAKKRNKKKDELVIITLRSDDLTEAQLEAVRKEVKKQIPNKRVAIFGIGRDDALDIQTIGG